MRIIVFTILMFTAMQSFAQEAYNVLKDKETGQQIFKGPLVFRDLDFEPSFTWMGESKSYKPNPEAITYLKEYLPQYNMVVFLGTWCDDSHNIVPKLYKVLQDVKYPMHKYSMYGVDREKKSKSGEEMLYHIVNVPTIILYKDNREVGRIVETLKKNIETDLENIIKADKAKL